MKTHKIGRRPKALIFEEDHLCAQEYKRALEAAGLNAFVTDNPEKARAWLNRYVPRLVLINIDSLGVGSEQLLDDIKHTPRLEKTKIFLVSKNVLSSRATHQSKELLLNIPVTFEQLKELSARYT